MRSWTKSNSKQPPSAASDKRALKARKKTMEGTPPDTFTLKVEDEPTKLKKPLQKTGPFVRNPLSLERIKHMAKNVGGALRWVRRHANSFPRRPETHKAPKGEYVSHSRSNPALLRRSLCRARRATPVFWFGCLSPRVRHPASSTSDAGGRRRTSTLECVRSPDEADLHGRAGNRHGSTLDPHAISRDLLRASEAVGKSLDQEVLVSNFSRRKTGWENIGDAEDLSKRAASILGRILREVSDRLEKDNPSISVDSAEAPYTADTEDNELYLSLCGSFDRLSIRASEFCLRKVSMVASCIGEYQYITDLDPASLFQPARELVDTYSEICRVREKMIIKRSGELAVIDWTKEQEENRVKPLWKLIEALSGCVVNLQDRFLQSFLVQIRWTGTRNEEHSKLESYLQESWKWLNKISKRVAVLCPSRKQVLFVYLLERFIEATEGLSNYQKQRPLLADAKRKKRFTNAAISCQKMLLHSLIKLFESAEKGGLKFKNAELAGAPDFGQTTYASHIYFIAVTRLFSVMKEQQGTTPPRSNHPDEILKEYEAELMEFLRPYVEVIDIIARESGSRTGGSNGSAGDVTEGQGNVDFEFPASVEPGANHVLEEELHRATHRDNREGVHNCLNSAGARRPLRPPLRLVKAQTAKTARLTPFAMQENVPPTNTSETGPGAAEALAENSTVGPGYFELPSEGADESLDRSVTGILNHGDPNGVDVTTMKEFYYLGEGASGQVSLFMLGTRKVAVKRSTCNNPARARQRLEKEATVHGEINSCVNVVRFLGRAVKIDETGEHQIVGIITEYCPLGDLSTAIHTAASIPRREQDGEDISMMEDSVGYQLYKNWTKRLEIVAGIATGMASMHSRRVVHRDLRSANVLLSRNDESNEYEVNICDFERGYYVPDGEKIKRTKACANSCPWMGPEVLRHESYDLKADVYSIGTILWELMYLENPWSHLRKKSFGCSLVGLQYFLTAEKISLSISENDAPAGVPEFPELVRLVKRAWAKDPTDRPTMAEFQKEVMAICARMKERVNAERPQE